MKFFAPVAAVAALLAATVVAEESNLPPDPFSSLDDIPDIPDYTLEVDRERGSFLLSSEDGTYVPGSHFANWSWKTSVERWGNYFVGLKYTSSRPKLGVQIKVGDEAVLKGYAGRTGGPGRKGPMIMGTAYLPEKGEYPVTLLTGDQSNDETFQVEGIAFLPAPENEPHGQSIDGIILLEAKTATTYAENMRYEPKPEKDCLGFWTDVKDWAEWEFEVSSPGKFTLSVTQGCGEGQGGSEVALLLDDQTLHFTVEDTGGFQNWKALDLGTVEIKDAGMHRLALVPRKKAAKAVMDIQKVVLAPVKE